MTDDERTTLERLKTYGNMSQDEAVEYHRLLNLEAKEEVKTVKVEKAEPKAELGTVEVKETPKFTFGRVGTAKK